MSPIGESTFGVPETRAGVEADAEPRSDEREVGRVGSSLACEEEGNFRSWYCPRDQTLVHVPVTCSVARLCPSCSRRWAWKEARKAAWRLAHVQKRKVYGNVPARHVVVSFADNTYETLDVGSYDKLFERAWRVLKRMGVRGGAAVVHPWRRQEVAENSTILGWRWVPGPHVHFLVWGFLDLKKRPGNAFVLVKDDKKKVRSDTATLAYVLDHCGMVARKHAIRWLGVASYNKCPGVPKPPREGLKPVCPVCGCDMKELGVEDGTFEGWLGLSRGLDHYEDGRGTVGGV